jgi:hypothetical protein
MGPLALSMTRDSNESDPNARSITISSRALSTRSCERRVLQYRLEAVGFLGVQGRIQLFRFRCSLSERDNRHAK